MDCDSTVLTGHCYLDSLCSLPAFAPGIQPLSSSCPLVLAAVVTESGQCPPPPPHSYPRDGHTCLKHSHIMSRLQLKHTQCAETDLIVQELCESRGGRPGLSVLTSLLVSVDVKIY